MLACTGDGKSLPPFMIIRCATAATDQSHVQVIKNLHKEPGFTAAEGWELGTWSGSIVTKVGSAPREYTRQYMLNKVCVGGGSVCVRVCGCGCGCGWVGGWVGVGVGV